MTRALLFFLALLQQFMPPGMCLCQALNARAATDPAPAVTVEREPAGCSCCKKNQARTEAPTDQPAPPPTPPPCCPGVHADADQGLLSADPVECRTVDAVADTPTNLTRLFLPNRSPRPACQTSGSPPLFIAFRTLLI